MQPRRAQPLCPARGVPRRGFALLITITLLAFIVLLLVSLAALTRVETQVAGNNRQLAQARQNALLALSVALGQLQKFTGPDQRVTAAAEIGGASNLNGVAGPDDGARHWTGVWGNRNAPSAQTGEAGLLNWLVSGNEAVEVAASAASATFGQITSAIPSPDYTPDGSGGGGAAPALTAASGPSDELTAGGRPWRLLVGPRSTDAVSGYVVAPLVEIRTPASGLPGFSPGDSTPTAIGRYAWWVGDEGVKARVNLLDPHATKTGDEEAERGFSFITAQRSALEWMDRAGASPAALGALHAPFDTRLEDILAPGQLALSSMAPAVTDEAMKARFHDLTTRSFGVLADAARGGLKKDLSRGLAADAPSAAESARGAAYAPPANRDWLFTPNNNGADSYGVPTWGLLRAYASRQAAPGAVLPVTPPARGSAGAHFFYDDAGVAPVVAYAGVAFDFTSPGADTEAEPPPAYPSPINLNLFPVVVLWNPYTVSLGAADYTVALGVRTVSQLQLREGGATGPVRAALKLNQADFAAPGSPAYFRFKLKSPVLGPGESRVFMLAASTDYTPGLTELVEGLNPTASAAMPTGATLANATDADKDFAFYAANSSGTALAGGEIDVILAEFDPAGQQPAGQDPETAATAWFSTVQRVGADISTQPPRRLAADTSTADLVFGFRVRANLPDSGSGLRLQWMAHGSARSPLMVRSKVDSWTNTTSGGTAGYNAAYAGRFGVPAGAPKWPDFNTTIPRASAGRTLAVTGGAPVDATLWEFPSPGLGLLSIGQLQHAPVALLGIHPSYAIGNGQADFRIPRTDTLTTANTHAGTSTQMVTTRINTSYDLSWHLNRALWDRYFFSSTPAGAAPSASSAPAWTQADIDGGRPLPNSRLHYFRRTSDAPSIGSLRRDGDASDPFNQAAANLMLAGGFNVNSASAQAWRAVLAGVNQLAYNPRTQAAGAALQAAFSRFAVPTADTSLGTPWQGYRQLDEDQTRLLADSIAAEVRRRGPFLSLADFVNRRLAADETGLKGALQAALDASTTGRAANLAATAPFNTDRVDSAPNTGESYDLDHMRNDTANTAAAHRSRSAFAPKFLTQADVLSALGPALAARSDTFVIRAYGETVNPLLASSDSGYVTGRAWCEAVVQRTPGYVDQADPALAAGGLRDALLPSATNETNRNFGRRFRVVSFRWITPSDI